MSTFLGTRSAHTWADAACDGLQKDLESLLWDEWRGPCRIPHFISTEALWSHPSAHVARLPQYDKCQDTGKSPWLLLTESVSSTYFPRLLKLTHIKTETPNSKKGPHPRLSSNSSAELLLYRPQIRGRYKTKRGQNKASSFKAVSAVWSERRKSNEGTRARRFRERAKETTITGCRYARQRNEALRRPKGGGDTDEEVAALRLGS